MSRGVEEMENAHADSEGPHEGDPSSLQRMKRRLLGKIQGEEEERAEGDWTGYYVASHDWPAFENDIPMEDVYRILDGFNEYLPFAQESLAAGAFEDDDGIGSQE